MRLGSDAWGLEALRLSGQVFSDDETRQDMAHSDFDKELLGFASGCGA